MQVVYKETFDKTIDIHASSSAVWEALSNVKAMSKWMFDSEIVINTDWKVGHPIRIQVDLDAYKTGFENKGIVLEFEPERILQYSHLSSLSGLPDELQNYSLITFTLVPNEDQTSLTLSLENFPTEIIYKHLVFYWEVTLELLKKFIEQDRA